MVVANVNIVDHVCEDISFCGQLSAKSETCLKQSIYLLV